MSYPQIIHILWKTSVNYVEIGWIAVDILNAACYCKAIAIICVRSQRITNKYAFTKKQGKIKLVHEKVLVESSYTKEQIDSLITRDATVVNLLAWKAGMNTWQPLNTFVEFASNGNCPPPIPE